MRDIDLPQRLYFAENDFLTALGSGTDVLSSFHQTWSALPGLLSTATATGNADNNMLVLAGFVASRISNIANCSLDIKRWEDCSTVRLQRDCDAMFHQMANLSLRAQPESLPQDNTSGPPSLLTYPCTSTLSTESSYPPFLTSAHQWLLDNLHNPYPTAEVKARIAAASSCQVSSVSSWFINARRRIGWTTLCRERFSNCRADMIDAAYRALVEEDPRRTLSPELRHSFVAMKVVAEGLYSSTLIRSTLAGDLDALVKDVTKEDTEFVEAGKCRRAELGKTVRDTYLSPDRSITASPVPPLDDSVTDESEEEDDVAPPIIAGSKRRRSSIEPVNQLSSIANRPIKRLRSTSTKTTSPTYLPSPPSSTDDISSDDGSRESSVVRSTQSETNEVVPSHRRRLSDADSVGAPKHPSVTPHLHTVTDPLPSSSTENESSIDDWFHTNFDALFAIPPPVDATEPDFSTSWQVELFRDYSMPENPKCAPKCSPAHTNISSDLDNLLQAIGSDTFTTPSESAPLFGAAGAPYATSLDPSVPNMSQTNLDWTSLLGGPDTFQSTIHSTFPQYPTDTQPLPQIDLSMLQLPHVMPPVDPHGDLALKQAKLQQLHAMQEAVRRMEQELQSEGVVI